MKYKKVTKKPFTLKKAKKSMIQVYKQTPGSRAQNVQYVEAYMVPATGKDDVMVLAQDVKALLPVRSRGAILPRAHVVNLTSLKELSIHPELYDAKLHANPKPAKKAPAKKPAAKKAEKPKDLDPNDVNKDGKVDAEDVKQVAEKAAAESKKKAPAKKKASAKKKTSKK